MTKDQDEITAVLKGYEAALNHGSTDEALALYAPDVSFIPLPSFWASLRVLFGYTLTRFTGSHHASEHAVLRGQIGHQEGI